MRKLCDHYTVPPLHCATITLCHHYTMPPLHCATITLCHHYTVPPLHCATITLCHHYTVPPLHCATITLCHHYTVPPLHCATITLCDYYTVPPSHYDTKILKLSYAKHIVNDPRTTKIQIGSNEKYFKQTSYGKNIFGMLLWILDKENDQYLLKDVISILWILTV